MPELLGNAFKELREALIASFSLAEFDTMLSDIGYDRERIATGIAAGKDEIVQTVIGTAEREGWTHKLVAGAFDANPHHPLLKAFIEKYPVFDPTKAPPPPVDHYRTMFLLGNRVFLHRKGLRDQVRNLGVDNNSRVMVVKGPRVSGKTYSRDFINYILERDPEQKKLKQKALYFYLDDYVAGPGDLAKRIGMRLGLKAEHMPPSSGEQDSRWVPELFDWIMAGVAADAAEVVWLILDGFRVQKLAPEANDLIARLVEEADASPGKLRVVLINYQLPELLEPYPLKEEIEPITREHIEAFIRHVYGKVQDKTGKTFTDVQVKDTVKNVLDQVDALIVNKPEEKERWLAHMSAALSKVAQKLSA
jgi:hypothetical protein